MEEIVSHILTAYINLLKLNLFFFQIWDAWVAMLAPLKSHSNKKKSVIKLKANNETNNFAWVWCSSVSAN